jgi:hypothetical protein
MLLLASALLAAVVATLLITIPFLVQIEEPWNIVVASHGLTLARTTFISASFVQAERLAQSRSLAVEELVALPARMYGGAATRVQSLLRCVGP